MSGQKPQIDQVGSSGDVVGQLMQDVGGLGVLDHQFTMMRNLIRERIFEYLGRKILSTDCRWQRLPELARRLEEILFRMFPTKNEYYYIMKGPAEPQLQIAIKRLLSAQNQQIPRQMASSSGYGTTIPTPGITQGATGNSRVPNVTDNTGLPSFGATLVPQNVEMRTSLPARESKDDGEPDGWEAMKCVPGQIHNQHSRE